MYKKLLLISLALLLVLSMIVIGCKSTPATTTPPPTTPSESTPPETAPQEVFELTFADIHPPQDPMNSVVNAAWFNWLEKESGGRIKITLMPAAQAAAPENHYDAARTGIVDIACQLMAFMPGSFTIPSVIELPFMFDAPGARASGLALMELYAKYPEFQAEFPGVKPLLFHCPGVFNVHTANKAVHTMEDFKGLVIEGHSPVLASILTTLGATPEYVGMEAPDAIAKGVMDGTIHNWPGVMLFGFIDAVHNSTDCSLAGPTQFVHVMNENTWNSLPPDLQELFVGENAWKLAELYGYQVDQDNIMFRQQVNDTYVSRGDPEIYVLPDDEKARWKDALMPIREAWVQETGAKIGEDTARAILEDALAFGEKYSYDNWPNDWQADTLAEWAAP